MIFMNAFSRNKLVFLNETKHCFIGTRFEGHVWTFREEKSRIKTFLKIVLNGYQNNKQDFRIVKDFKTIFFCAKNIGILIKTNRASNIDFKEFFKGHLLESSRNILSKTKRVLCVEFYEYIFKDQTRMFKWDKTRFYRNSFRRSYIFLGKKNQG